MQLQAAGSSKALSVQELLTAPITRTFPRFLWSCQHLSGSSLSLSNQLFDRLLGASGPMKLPVQVHVVVQPAGWVAAAYVLSRAPWQQVPVTQSTSSVPGTVGASGAGWDEVPAAALPADAAGPGSKPLGPFPAYASRNASGQLRLVEIKHNSQLDSYRCARGSPDAHDVVGFEQVSVYVLVNDAEVVGPLCQGCRWTDGCGLLCLHALHCCGTAAVT
jgi:hypothetical protein